MQDIRDRSAGSSLAALSTAAIQAGAPVATADEARRVTAARFHVPGPEAAVSKRAESYFWGVVRRCALCGGAPALQKSMLAVSLATELTAAGHSADAVRREVARLYGAALLRYVEPLIRQANAA